MVDSEKAKNKHELMKASTRSFYVRQDIVYSSRRGKNITELLCNNKIRWLKLQLVTIFFSGDFLVLLCLHLLPWFHIWHLHKHAVLWSKLVTKAKNVLSSVRENSMNKGKSLRSWKASFSIFLFFQWPLLCISWVR